MHILYTENLELKAYKPGSLCHEKVPYVMTYMYDGCNTSRLIKQSQYERYTAQTMTECCSNVSQILMHWCKMRKRILYYGKTIVLCYNCVMHRT